MFNVYNGYGNIDNGDESIYYNIVFKITESKLTRGHNFTLVQEQTRLDVRKHSLFQRTIIPSICGMHYLLIVWMLVVVLMCSRTEQRDIS